MQASTGQPAYALLLTTSTCFSFPGGVADLASPEDRKALLEWCSKHNNFLMFDLVLQRDDVVEPSNYPGGLVGCLSDVEHWDGPLVGEFAPYVGRIFVRDPIRPVSCRSWFRGMRTKSLAASAPGSIDQRTSDRWGIYGIENLDMSRCRDVSLMFADCLDLWTARLDAWNLSSCRRADKMFAGCIKLGDVTLPDDLSQLESALGMFSCCSMLNGALDFSNVSAPRLAAITGMFANCDSLSAIGLPHAAPTDVSYLFAGCSLLQVVENADLSACSNARAMFASCLSLRNVDLAGWTGDHLVDASDMFYGCASLSKVDLRHLIAPKLRSASEMFGQCRSLSTVRLTSFSPAAGWDASRMFADCPRLSSISICRKDPSAPSSASGMFQRCDSLINLDARGLELDQCMDVRGMFDGCKVSLTLKPSSKGFRSSLEARGAFEPCRL